LPKVRTQPSEAHGPASLGESIPKDPTPCPLVLSRFSVIINPNPTLLIKPPRTLRTRRGQRSPPPSQAPLPLCALRALCGDKRIPRHPPSEHRADKRHRPEFCSIGGTERAQLSNHGGSRWITFLREGIECRSLHPMAPWKTSVFESLRLGPLAFGTGSPEGAERSQEPAEPPAPLFPLGLLRALCGANPTPRHPLEAR